jgi:hypothetical protein
MGCPRARFRAVLDRFAMSAASRRQRKIMIQSATRSSPTMW